MPDAVVHDRDAHQAAALDGDVDPACTGVERVLHQLLDAPRPAVR